VIASVVYALCAAASLLCVGLLARSWRQTRAALLMWSLVCFVGLAANNLVLFVDKVIVTGADLAVWRALPAAIGIAALIYGLVRETER
jgi:hypothetical protein